MKRLPRQKALTARDQTQWAQVSQRVFLQFEDLNWVDFELHVFCVGLRQLISTIRTTVVKVINQFECVLTYYLWQRLSLIPACDTNPSV